MAILSLVAAAILIVVAFLFRRDDFLLALFMGIGTLFITDAVHRLSVLDRQFLWPTLLAGTIYRRRLIRVSIAYLFSIPVQGTQLLVRGGRITTQFQPVGGVFKSYLSEAELQRRFSAIPDGRFTPDQRSKGDLRLRLPGKNLYALIQWFRSREERELFPIREFHEELIASGLLPSQDFHVFDCRFLGLRSLPLTFDTYSQCMQLIIGEIYELRPTPDQEKELIKLKSLTATAPSTDVLFATPTEIRHGGATAATSTTYDLAPTTRWLVGEIR